MRIPCEIPTNNVRRQALILYGLYAWSNIMNFEEDEDALVVELYAQLTRVYRFWERHHPSLGDDWLSWEGRIIIVLKES